MNSPQHRSGHDDPERSDEEISITGILKDNAAREQAAENPVLPKKISRRKSRDFLILVILGNLLLLAPLLIQPSNLFVAIFSVSGMLVFTIGLTWIIWFVLSDY